MVELNKSTWLMVDKILDAGTWIQSHLDHASFHVQRPELQVEWTEAATDAFSDSPLGNKRR